MIRITKYKPGKARGANDLQTWASRRLVGLSGMPTPKKKKRKRNKWEKFHQRRQQQQRPDLFGRKAFNGKTQNLSPTDANDGRLMKKPKHVVVGTNGDPCPRCKQPTEIREHKTVTDKHRAQPFYYSRWFNCTNPNCRTNLIMPDRFRVFRDDYNRDRFEDRQGQPFSDAALDVLDEMKPQTKEPMR